MFVDHQSGKKAYFKRKLDEPLTAAASYEKGANTYGLWDAVGGLPVLFIPVADLRQLILQRLFSVWLYQQLLQEVRSLVLR